MGIQVYAHTSYLGHTGYNNHSKNFFTHLDRYVPTRVRNYSYCDDLSYLTKEQMSLLVEQKWNDPPHKIGTPFIRDRKSTLVNIVLNESHHYFFYDNYQHPMIAYNVWEATKQMPEFFNRILEYDQFWCPTEWQKDCTIEQGYPEDRVKVVREAVNGEIFQPATSGSERKKLFEKYSIDPEKFAFMIFGRWDYRKSITEMIRAFVEEFEDNDDVVLIVSVDNPFPTDGIKTTEARLEHHGIPTDKIKIVHFPPREDYVKFMQHGNCLVSCSRSEGWNLPLIEAIASGTPTIASNWGAHLEFAEKISHLVDVPHEVAPQQIYFMNNDVDYGVWGEPDYDHLKEVMRDVYGHWDEAKELALMGSKEVRAEFTWDNAAHAAYKHIEELTKKYKSMPTPIKNYFTTNFEVVDGCPRAHFKSSANFKNVTVRFRTKEGNTYYETKFDEIEADVGYWIALNTSDEYLVLEIIDKMSVLIYSEEKVISQIKNVRYESTPTGHMELYQDQIVNGKVIVEGKRDCSPRFDVIRKVFEQYKRPFTILDIGANFGYYSIRAASAYGATAVMVESEDNEVKTLINLCEKNDCGDRLTVLQTRFDLYKLKELSKCEHFDVILALNVIHHFNPEEILGVCKTLTKLGDNLILETPPADDHGACGQNNLKTIIDYFSDEDKIKLGEFKRHTSNTLSEMFWLKTESKILEWPYYEYEKLFENKNLDIEGLKNRSCDGSKSKVESNFDMKRVVNPRKEDIVDWIPGINLKTFNSLNGVYPLRYKVIEKLKSRNIKTDYTWDDSNNDLIIHNFLLNGTELHLIDFDDKLIDSGIYGDQKQLDRVINELAGVKEKVKANYICHFVDGPLLEVQGEHTDDDFAVDFLDSATGASVHQDTMKINTWTRPNRKYYTDWLIQVRRNGKLEYEHAFDLTGKPVLISFDSKGMGDTIAWIPYVEEFRKKHNCIVYLSTFWNELFRDHEDYSKINFVNPGRVVNGLYASYMIGCYDNNTDKNKINWRIVPLQKMCSDILGLEYKEIVPNVSYEPMDTDIDGKYVTISEFSTFQCKFWNLPNGWQNIVDYLNGIGYKVMVISKEKTKLKNIINRTNRPINETMNNIKNSELLLGVSSGPAWLAWALKVPTVLISGYSDPICEFTTNTQRVINNDVCCGCIHRVEMPFERGDWSWCPVHKGTDRQYECTKKISVDMVKDAINKIIIENHGDIKINESPDRFHVPSNEIRNLKIETKDFDWKKFHEFGPARTAYHEIYIQEDYSHGDCKVEEGDIVIDVGANIGIFTRYADTHGAKKILSFEAEKVNFEYLLKNQPESCNAFNLAVSDNNDKQDLFVKELGGSHTLLPKSIENASVNEVQCITLDKIFEIHKLDKVDFLKMDIEGAELKAFDGITDENLSKIRKVSLEYHHQIFNFDKDVRTTFIERFIRLGFKPYILHLRDDCLNMLYFWKQ